MHILFIPAWWPSANDPTCGIFNQKQAKGLANLGCQVGTVYFENQLFQPISFWRFGTEIGQKVGINQVKKHGFWFLPKKKTWLLNLWTSIYDQLFEKYVAQFGRPDLLHGFGFQSIFVAARLSEKWGIPFVFTEHATAHPLGLIPDWQLEIFQKKLSKAAKVLAVSRGMAQELNKIWPGEIGISPPLFLEEDFPAFDFLEKKREETVFLTACALMWKKGVDVLIAAFELACTLSPDPIKLIIVGDGEASENIEFLIKNSPFSQKITRFGSLTGDDFAKKYREADCFVLASRVETFGTVLIEAMANGLPIITTRSGGPEFFIHENLGKLVEPGDAHVLAEAMLFYLKEKGRFNRAEIRHHALENYSEGPVSRALLAIYQSIISKNKKNGQPRLSDGRSWAGPNFGC